MFTHEHRVRYHETDAQHFLFNSRYLEIADVAMAEFFRDLGWTYPAMVEAGLDPSVVQVSLTFERPARFDDVLAFHVVCPRVGRSSFDLHHDVRLADLVIARASLTYVNVDPPTGRARPVPADLAAALRGTNREHAAP
jgi:acyl-CoA thioester hydrolase